MYTSTQQYLSNSLESLITKSFIRVYFLNNIFKKQENKTLTIEKEDLQLKLKNIIESKNIESIY